MAEGKGGWFHSHVSSSRVDLSWTKPAASWRPAVCLGPGQEKSEAQQPITAAAHPTAPVTQHGYPAGLSEVFNPMQEFTPFLPLSIIKASCEQRIFFFYFLKFHICSGKLAEDSGSDYEIVHSHTSDPGRDTQSGQKGNPCLLRSPSGWCTVRHCGLLRRPSY